MVSGVTRPPIIRPTMTSTMAISISVKPRWRPEVCWRMVVSFMSGQLVRRTHLFIQALQGQHRQLVVEGAAGRAHVVGGGPADEVDGAEGVEQLVGVVLAGVGLWHALFADAEIVLAVRQHHVRRARRRQRALALAGEIIQLAVAG